MFKNAKVGDKVYCRIHGNGKIIAILPEIGFDYPIQVQFSQSTIFYTIEGKIYKSAVEHTLFYRDDTYTYLTERPEPKIDWSNVKVDTKIIVGGSKNTCCYKRYFAKFEDDTIYAWTNGATSWSVEDKSEISSWNYAKLVEE